MMPPLDLYNKPLKSVGEFTYLGSNISSTESDVNICIGKVLAASDMLTTIWKSGVFDKIKQEFFQVVKLVSTTVWLHHLDFNKMSGEKARWKLHKDAAQILKRAPYKTAAE